MEVKANTLRYIAQVIVDIMADIKKQMAPQGIAILSGIILERKPDILTSHP